MTTNGHHPQANALISGIAHVNLTVPSGTLDQAHAFYGETLGLKSRPVPELQKGTLAWFDIADSGQQIHIAFGPSGPKSSRHPCFRIASPDALLELRRRVWEHHLKGGDSAPQEADQPGAENSGSKGAEYPQRFFARDYAGNRLEFSL
ncbi:Glyoxalase/Bleomycin resistance protein/Dihydroxybiphenyl dioxygenase [Neohortaea acidophila]|uniref:Glyoxalase/Bleomycin resistance protein/Dihydroxybiphenyl dioxygenase n=1 Tax=Neohortaea acidophila TaxID=245834 RepID=A0A6A6Q5A5_9PEZI|nr:Glyoxalase/Bleomycin resistance protein/Dihydroxybiphenyl dioxygenase [Neohortaea acidophila]KAF2487495.1 Glyoxalase/Bleomycin resistance protein/Dihydroxybiphenyl dioxygenase [Neohortaea acidophila]